MSTWTIVEGDTEPLLTAELSDESGVRSLAEATCEITATIGTTSVTKTGTVLSPASAGRVSFDFEGALPAGLGTARIKVTFASGKVRYFPSGSAIQIRVVARS